MLFGFDSDPMLYENKIHFVQLSLFLMVPFRHMMSLDVLTGTGACKYDVHKLKPQYTETLLLLGVR